VHMGDKDAPNLARSQVALEELMLRSLTTIEQPKLGPLGQLQHHPGNVTGAGRNT
jgi:hypothetical protein